MKTIIAILLFIIPSFSGGISPVENQYSRCYQSEVPVKEKFLKYIGEFSTGEDCLNFKLSNYKIFFDYKNQKININKEGSKIGAIDIDKQYNGPGYRIYLFGDVAEDYHMIVIEALADIGTEWYSVVLLNDEKIINQCLISDPRANSDICNIEDFMEIFIINNYCEIQLNKKHIARYSYIPKTLRADPDFVYITMPIVGSRYD